HMAGDPLNLFAGIFLREGDRHIGNIKLGPINVHHRRADIGLLVGDRACWGKGYASEAIAILSDFAFGRLGLHRLTAGMYAENEGSARAFEKAGYAREGLLRGHWLCDGTPPPSSAAECAAVVLRVVQCAEQRRAMLRRGGSPQGVGSR
ncbi:MAG TPA: GNAT family protein, partial [Arthrobacter sp.]